MQTSIKNNITKVKDFFDFKKQKSLRAAAKQAKEQQAKRYELADLFRRLKALTHHVDKSLPNRHERKRFWSEFIKSHQVRVGMLDRFLEGVSGKGILDERTRNSKQKRNS